MSLLEEIAREIRTLRVRGYRPRRIEIGTHQALLLADEMAQYPVPMPPTLAAILAHLRDDVPLPTEAGLTVEQILAGGTIWGVPYVGVESPDYLALTVDEATG